MDSVAVMAGMYVAVAVKEAVCDGGDSGDGGVMVAERAASEAAEHGAAVARCLPLPACAVLRHTLLLKQDGGHGEDCCYRILMSLPVLVLELSVSLNYRSIKLD
ncbi:hypothetical protein E2C01_036234 [Portunus trituberculatus]|uniref:Uncharacterized protein n=1 Tax=Portunus trituberculatus TaxID=210409 RepID=A0A5B7FBI2_PORTR|nr:hypothetical protein [Portunus trituberculatus]